MADNPFDQFDSHASAANPFDQFDANPKDTPTAPISDTAKTFGGAALSGVGDILSGAGNLARAAAKPIADATNALGLTDNVEPTNPLAGVAGALQRGGQSLSESATPLFQRNTQQFQVLHPSTWTPSGAAGSAAQFAGGVAPLVAANAIPGVGEEVDAAKLASLAPDAAAAATRAATAKSLATNAVLFGAQSGGGAIREEHDRIMGMGDDDLAKVPAYQQALASGQTPAQARESVAEKSANAASLPATAVGALGGLALGGPLAHGVQAAAADAIGGGLGRKLAIGAGTDATLMGAQGVAQQAATTAAANAATGEQRDPLKDAVSTFAANAIGGVPFGLFGGYKAHEYATDKAASDQKQAEISQQLADAAAAKARGQQVGSAIPDDPVARYFWARNTSDGRQWAQNELNKNIAGAQTPDDLANAQKARDAWNAHVSAWGTYNGRNSDETAQYGASQPGAEATPAGTAPSRADTFGNVSKQPLLTDNRPAPTQSLPAPSGIAVDSEGNATLGAGNPTPDIASGARLQPTGSGVDQPAPLFSRSTVSGSVNESPATQQLALPAPGGYTVDADGNVVSGAPNPTPLVSRDAALRPLGGGVDQPAPLFTRALPFPNAERGSLADAANQLPVQTEASTNPPENLPQPSGSNAQSASPQESAPSGSQAATASGNQGTAPRTSNNNTPAPPPVPPANLSTPEAIHDAQAAAISGDPTAIRAYVKATALQGNAPTAEQMVKLYGLTPRDASELRRSVMLEIKNPPVPDATAKEPSNEPATAAAAGETAPAAVGDGKGLQQPETGRADGDGQTGTSAPGSDTAAATAPEAATKGDAPAATGSDVAKGSDSATSSDVGKQEQAAHHVHQTTHPVQEVPLDKLTLSRDVPQFKQGADGEGVVEPLGGTFDRRGVGAVQVWKRKNGDMEVVSGRHRLDLARRSGEQTIPAQVYNEADGFTAHHAANLDAELNIRDGQGKVADYVQHFQNPAYAGEKGRQLAESRGLLARATGQRAHAIASNGDSELIAAHRAGGLSDDAATQLANAAPKDQRLQALGMKLIQDGKPTGVAVNTMRAVKSMSGDNPPANGDMFGFDAGAIDDAVKMAGVATAKQRELGERLAAITGAAKRPELAKKEGINVKNPKAVEKRIGEIRAEKIAWDNWHTDPAKVAAIRDELGLKERPADNPVTTAAHEAATSPKNDRPEPTEAQKEAGNFKMGHIKIAGMDVSIEHPAGVARKEGHQPLTRAYGYIRGTTGKDGDHVDVFLGDHATDETKPVFVVDQHTKDGQLDEHKIILGEDSEAAAREAYLSNYPKGWNGLGAITEMTHPEFKEWLADPKNMKRRASDPAQQGFALESAPAKEAVAKPAEEQGGLFAPPTAKEKTQAAVASKDAERNGLGRDLVKPSQGDGELLAGAKPEQASVPEKKTSQARAAYDAASDATSRASREFQTARDDYRAKRIDDATFLAAKKKHDAALAAFDEAERAYQSGKESKSATAEQAPITDLGEKIGGARKDLSGGRSDKAAEAPRYEAVPTREGNRWVVQDAKTGKRIMQNWTAKMFDTEAAAKTYADQMNTARAKAKASDSAWRKRYAVVDNNTGALDRKPWAVRDLTTGKMLRGSEGDTQAEVEGKIPLLLVAQKHRVIDVAKKGEDPSFEIWRDITDRKRVKVVDQQFPTRDDAMRYMAQHASDILSTSTRFGEEHLARPDKVNRVGAVVRDGDVAGKHFMDAFGFRGVEFGNWNSQAERQEVMNHAYDGLHDLADTLGLPPKAISLNGELALAFGARGHGLDGARAHFEPQRNVINLTKMQGAGALAHEWFHALDQYLGRLDGRDPGLKVKNADGTTMFRGSDSSRMLSHGVSTQSKMRAELQQPYRDLINTMSKKAEQYTDDTAQVAKFVGRTQENLAGALQQLRTELTRGPESLTHRSRNNKPASAEQLATFDALAQKLLGGPQTFDLRHTQPDSGKVRGSSTSGSSMRMTNDTLEEMSAIYKAVRGRTGFSADQSGVLDQLRGYARQHADRLRMLESAQNGETKTKQIPTSYAMEAKKIDQRQIKDYWTTPHEMAARAFSAYVEDKLAERGNSSDFLSFGSDNTLPTYRLLGVKPFPEGVEREAMDKAFDQFFGEVKTAEDEKGNVALYSRTSDATTDNPVFLAGHRSTEPAAPAKGISTDAAEAAIRPLRMDFAAGLDRNGISIDVVPDKSVFRGEAAAGESIKGGYYPASKRIVLVASDLRDSSDARATLRHELVAHFGLNLFTPEVKQRVLDGIGQTRDRAGFDSLWKGIDKDYAGETDSVKAEELFARVAEKPPSLLRAWWDKFLSKVVLPALRKVGLVRADPTMAELRDLASSLANGIREGKAQRTFPEGDDAQFRRGGEADDTKGGKDDQEPPRAEAPGGAAGAGNGDREPPKSPPGAAPGPERTSSPRAPGESDAHWKARIEATEAKGNADKVKAYAAAQRDLGRGAIRDAWAQAARRLSQADAAIGSFMRYFDKRPADVRKDWLKNYASTIQFEHGDLDKIADPVERDAFAAVKSLLADQLDKIHTAGGKLNELAGEYFPHLWADPIKAAKLYAELNARRPLAGSTGFRKERFHADYEAGIKSGLEPKFDNPMEAAMFRYQQGEKYLAALNIKKGLDELGQVKPIGADDRVPQGYARVNDNTFAGKVVPELVANDLNNHLAPGLGQFKSWQGLRYLQNMMVGARLGLSAFHAGFTTVDTGLTHIDLALRSIMRGSLGDAFQHLGAGLKSPIMSPLEGRKFLNMFTGKQAVSDPHTAALLDALTKGGARARMDPTDWNNSWAKLRKAWDQKDKKAIAANFIGGAVEGTSRWMQHYLVPYQKMTARMVLMKDALDARADALGKQKGDYAGITDAMHPDALRQIAGDVVKRVDERLGQVAYDNLFWNRIAKDIAQGSIQAVGWNVGTANTIFGGMADVRKIFKPDALLSPLDKAGKITSADMGRVTGRLSYLIAMNVGIGMLGATTQQMLTGQAPQELKDYFFPKTGRTNADGSPERLSFPSYMKDEYSLLTHPIATAEHKLNPSISTVAELLNNEDFYGVQVRDPNDPWYAQAGEVAEHLAKGFEPYAIQGSVKNQDAGQSAAMSALPFVGVTPAPADIARSPFQEFLANKAADSAPQGARSLEQASESSAKHDAENQLRQGQKPDLSQFSAQQRHEIQHDAKTSVPVIRFKRLGIVDKLNAFDQASSDERQQYKLRNLIVNGNWQREVANLPESDRQAVRERVMALRQ